MVCKTLVTYIVNTNFWFFWGWGFVKKIGEKLHRKEKWTLPPLLKLHSPFVWMCFTYLRPAYRTQGVVEHYLAISNNLEESESIKWGVLLFNPSTIGGSIARVEIEFQRLQAAESLGAAQQTDEEEIGIPPPTALITIPLLAEPPRICATRFPIPHFSGVTL